MQFINSCKLEFTDDDKFVSQIFGSNKIKNYEVMYKVILIIFDNTFPINLYDELVIHRRLVVYTAKSFQINCWLIVWHFIYMETITDTVKISSHALYFFCTSFITILIYKDNKLR